MAYETLDTLTFDNCTKVSEYQASDRSIRVRQVEPSGPELVPAGVPERTYPAGFQIAQFRDGMDRITQVALAGNPYVRVDVELNYYTDACDLTGEVSVVGTTATLTAATSHPPIAYAVTGRVLTPEETVYTDLLPGNYVAGFTDAAGCHITRSFTVLDPNPPADPNGLLIDEFDASNGDHYKLYYRNTAYGRTIVTARSPGVQGELAFVTEAERGYANGTLLGEGFCEGSTRVRFRALTGNPFLSIEALENSPDCGFEVVPALNIDSVDPFAPTGPLPARGSADLWTSGGKAPIYAFIENVTPADLTLVNGATTIEQLLPGVYTVQVVDSSTPPQRRYATFRVPAYVAPVVGCFDEEAQNYNPRTTQPDNTLCVYAPKWRSLWPSLPIDVHVAQDPLPAFVEAELYAGLPPGHPQEAGRPLAFLTTLRATVAPRTGVARFDVTPYLRGQVGALGSDGFRRLDLNSPTAYSDDTFCYFRLRVAGKTIESGYVLNSAVADAQLVSYITQGVPLTPFGQRLPMWPGYSFTLPVVIVSENGRWGFVEAVEDYTNEDAGVLPVYLPCPRYGLPVRWLSPEGGYGYWVFAGKHQYGDDIGEGSLYQEAGSNEQRYSAAGVARRTYQVSTGPFAGRNLVEGLRTLRRAVQVWAQLAGPGSAWVPVVVGRGAFPAYREGQTRYQFDVSFTEAVPQHVQGQ